MDTNLLLTISIACTTAAVIIQAGILIALYLSVRKTSARMEALASEVSGKTLPTVEMIQSLIGEVRPKIELIAENVTQTTTLVRSQIQRIDVTVNDVIDRTRLQVIRADELMNRTLDKVEETTETVHHTVMSPIRQFSGLLQGVTAGVQYFLGRRQRRSGDGVGVPQDELFI
jgi:tetrahydromethanopterin S-methyltransferase subunit F